MNVKEKTLMMLEENRDVFISGEKLAEKIGVSRNAIWKAIKQLEAEGYSVEAIRNKGYRLDKMNNKLSPPGIRSYLDDQFKNLSVTTFEEVGSTNDYAKELANEGASHGTMIVANHQTKGRGRYGRQFESPKNTGVYMSLILDPKQLGSIPPALLTAYVAVVVSDVLEMYSDKTIGIKWVNDLFIDRKKVAGILTEATTSLETGEIEWVVVGIGINVSTSKQEFSEDLKQKVTSLFHHDKTLVNRNELVARLVSQLLTACHQRTLDAVMLDYLEKSIIVGELVEVHSGNKSYEGIVQTILNDGSLVVKTTEGMISTIRFGEVSIKI